MFKFDSSTAIFLKKAEDDESKSRIVSKEQLMREEEFKAEEEKRKDPINKGMELAKETALNQGQQAEQTSKLLGPRSMVIRWMKDNKGYTDADIQNIESLPYPMTTIWEAAFVAMNASIESGYEDFKKLFDLSLQSYANNPNKEATTYLVKEAAKLQGENLNIPQIMDTLLAAAKGQDVSSDIQSAEIWFGEDYNKSDQFSALLSIAQLQYVDDIDKANIVYQRAKDILDKSRINMNIARGVADMIMSAPFMQEEARLINYFRTLFGLAVESPFVRAWSGIFRSLQVGENMKKQLEVSIKGTPSQQDMNIKTNSAYSRSVLAQASNPYNDFVKSFLENKNKILGYLNVPDMRQYANAIQSFSNAVTELSTTDISDQKNSEKSKQIAETLNQVVGSLPAPPIDEKQKAASTNKNIKLAQSAGGIFSTIITGIGSVALGAGAVTLLLRLFAEGKYTQALYIISTLATFIIGVINQFKGSAELPGLSATETTSLNANVDAMTQNSKDRTDLKRLLQNITQYSKYIDENKKLISSTVQNMIDIGAGKTDTAVTGTPEQAWFRYNKFKQSIEVALADTDKYVNKYLSLNAASIATDADTKAKFERDLLGVRNKRQEFINLYTEISSVAVIADNIQKKSKFIQDMKSMDEGAKIISKIYGPTALAGMMTEPGGILAKAQQIIATEEEALQKLRLRKRQIESTANAPTNDPNKDITKEQAELSSLDKQIQERETNIVQLRGWYMSQNPYAGEYTSFLSVASNQKFRKVKSNSKTADQKNIDYVGDYYNEVFENAKDKPEFGEALKNPSKWRKVPTTDIP